MTGLVILIACIPVIVIYLILMGMEAGVDSNIAIYNQYKREYDEAKSYDQKRLIFQSWIMWKETKDAHRC